MFAFVRSHLAALAGCDTGAPAGVLRMIVEERALGGAPRIRSGKPKICVELAANVRGYRRAFQTWQHLGLEGYETVYVAHLWSRIGRRLPWATHAATRAFQGHFLEAYVQVMAENGWDYIQRQYPNVIGLITQSDSLDVADIERLYHPIALKIEDDDASEFKQKPPHYKMYYSWHQSHQLALQAAPDADIYIRIRPDLYFDRALDLDWTEFAAKADAENIIYTQFPRKYLPTGGPIGVGDQIAIGGRRGIGVYCSTFNDTLAAFEGKLYGYPLKWAGHDNVSFSTFYHSVRAIAHPNLPPNNPMFDPPPLAARVIRERIGEDIAGRAVTAVDQMLLAALERDLA